VSKDEKMMILQMVADGKITPEQGAELLKALGLQAPAARPAPQAPSVPQVPSVPPVRVEEVVRRVESVADEIASRAGDLAEKSARHAEEIAEKAARGGEELGKMLARIFGGRFQDGPQFEFHEELKGELPAEGEIEVNFSTSNGRITVDTWDETGFRLDVKKTVNASTEEEAKELVKDGFEFNQDGLKLTARPKDSFGVLRNGYSVSFHLTLPRGRTANLRLSSSNGRITVEDVKGTTLVASTANGRVETKGCSFQRTEVHSANGRIELEGRLGDLEASTANGRIDASLAGTGAWELNSANGRIEVEIRREPDAAYEVDLSTVMGKIDVSGLENAEVLIDEARRRGAGGRYKARTRGFSEAVSKLSLRASTTMGRVNVSF